MTQYIGFFMLITTMIYLPQTFSPWNEEEHYAPGPNTTDDCEMWILRSGFHESDTKTNISRAKQRDPQIDAIMPIWAVLYAHIYSAFTYVVLTHDGYNAPYTPKIYCQKHNKKSGVVLPFQNFSNFYGTCEEWLQLYCYEFENPNNINWVYANNRDETEDDTISLWVAVYGQLISNFDIDDTISFTEFCSVMVTKGKIMFFMSLNETRMPCEEWIILSGFNAENILTNVHKAKRERIQFQKYKKFINSWTQYYVEHLLNASRLFKCFGSEKEGDDVPMTPSNFCEQRRYIEPVGYFDKKNK